MKLSRPAALLLALSTPAIAAADLPLPAEGDRLDYLLGYQLGRSYRSRGLSLTNPDALVRGARDAIEDRSPLLSFEQMQATFLEVQRRRLVGLHAVREQELADRRAKGREFLAAKAGQKGVVQRPSGLQYRVRQEGTGRAPGPEDVVTVHYRGTLVDGTEFDSSYRNAAPATFRIDEVIAGWTEGLQLVKEGARFELYVPPELAYGSEGELAGQTLVFEVELIEVGATGTQTRTQ